MEVKAGFGQKRPVVLPRKRTSASALDLSIYDVGELSADRQDTDSLP